MTKLDDIPSHLKHLFSSKPSADGKAVIKMAEGHLSDTVDAAIAALRYGEPVIYQQAGRLVHLVRHDSTTDGADLLRPTGAFVVEDVGKYLLKELLGSTATWAKYDARMTPKRVDPADPDKKGAWKESSPTLDIALHVADRGQWNLHVLKGAIEAPTLRRDGTVLDQPGYDLASGLFLDTNNVVFGTLQESPMRDDAMRGLGGLKDVLKDFPFVPDNGDDWHAPGGARSVALSAIMTGLVRRTLATAPAHAVTAPTPGTGKTKVAEIVTALVSGRTPTTISYGKTQEEFEKRLFSVLRAGDAVVIIDNVEADHVSSDEFCTVLTSESYNGRVLGVSQMATVLTNSLFVINGNNLRFRGDITQRVIVSKLDARMEDPKSRKFDRDPVQYALDHRAALVTGALTIMRAHAVAGYPGLVDLKPSRFPAWDKMVRAALVWLGEPDPQTTTDKIVDVDPERDLHTALMVAMNRVVGAQHPMTAQELLDRAQVLDEDDAAKFKRWACPWPEEEAPVLNEAIQNALAANRAKISAQTLGMYLSKVEGRPFNDMMIQVLTDKKRGNAYQLVFI